jgi:hypothetical protein
MPVPVHDLPPLQLLPIGSSRRSRRRSFQKRPNAVPQRIRSRADSDQLLGTVQSLCAETPDAADWIPIAQRVVGCLHATMAQADRGSLDVEPMFAALFARRDYPARSFATVYRLCVGPLDASLAFIMRGEQSTPDVAAMMRRTTFMAWLLKTTTNVERMQRQFQTPGDDRRAALCDVLAWAATALSEAVAF